LEPVADRGTNVEGGGGRFSNCANKSVRSEAPADNSKGRLPVIIS
jgi:hypothetical protein